MSAKKTGLLAAELRVIADTLTSDYCHRILKDAADRLEDTEKIADFYHRENERLRRVLKQREKKN